MTSPAVTSYGEEIAEVVNEMTLLEIRQFTRTFLNALNENPFEVVVDTVQDVATAGEP